MIPKIPATRNPTTTDPGAFALIGTEHNIVVAHALTTTTAPACLITAFLRKLVALPVPGGAGTNLDVRLDGHHVLVLEDGWRASGALGFRHYYCWRWTHARVRGFSNGMEVLNPPLWLMTLSNPTVACSPAVCLQPGQREQRHAGHGKFGSLRKCALSLLGRVEDLRCVV